MKVMIKEQVKAFDRRVEERGVLQVLKGHQRHCPADRKTTRNRSRAQQAASITERTSEYEESTLSSHS
jgi:hypothetical protein